MIQPGKLTGFELGVEDPGIVVVTFNEPERLNGMTRALKRDLVEVLTQCQMDEAVRVVVFVGSGRAFSAGDDISAGATRDRRSTLVPEIDGGHRTPIGTYEGLRIVSQPVNSALRTLDKLTIAAINGVAIQTGLSLALACDFRVAARSARLGSATLRFGLLPDEGGQYLLVQHLGVARAMDFLMRKRIVDAEEAHRLGLVHEVVDDDALLGRALELARELAAGPQVAMRLLKRSIYKAAELTWEQSLDEIAAKTAIGDHHADAREGVASFREKRPPKFNRWLEES